MAGKVGKLGKWTREVGEQTRPNPEGGRWVTFHRLVPMVVRSQTSGHRMRDKKDVGDETSSVKSYPSLIL